MSTPRTGAFASTFVVTLLLSAALPALAGDPVLVKDVKVTPDSHSNPEDLFPALGKLFFTATTGAEGTELWVTDPAAGTTNLVKDLAPGSQSSDPGLLGELNGWLYFFATDDADESQTLWRTDGTIVESVSQVGPRYSGRADLLGVAAGRLYFEGYEPTTGAEPWSTDGSTTQIVADVGPLNGWGSPRAFAIAGGTVYFTASGSSGAGLWRTTATGAEQVPMVDPNNVPIGSSLSFLTIVANEVFFAASGTAGSASVGNEIWKTTAAGVKFVGDLYPGPSGSNPAYFGELNGLPHFAGSLRDPISGAFVRSLFRVDPTGPVRLFDFKSSQSEFVISKSGKIFYTDTESAPANTGEELWSTDGTVAGTGLVQDIYPGAFKSSSPSLIVDLGSTGIIAATDAQGREPWLIDWVNETATQLADVSPGIGSSRPEFLGSAGGMAILLVYTYPEGDQLYAADATGVQLLIDLHPGKPTGLVREPSEAGGKLYFSFDDLQFGRELWVTDGTPTGTVLAEDIEPTVGSHSDPSDLTQVGTMVVFAAGDGVHPAAHGRELWTSDGTIDGTTQLPDINAGPDSSDPVLLADLGSRALFRSVTRINASGVSKLWGTDGASLTLLHPAVGHPRVPYSSPPEAIATDLTASPPVAYFKARDIAGFELWKTDGVTASMHADIYPGSGSGSPDLLAAVGGSIYIRANNGPSGYELFKITPTGVHLVVDLDPRLFGTTSGASSNPVFLGELSGKALFTAAVSNVRNLYLLDPSTDSVTLLESNFSGTYLDQVGGLAYFNRSIAGQVGFELYSTDGTVNGLYLVKDVWPGSGSSSPLAFGVLNNRLIFTAISPGTNRSLWESDGTAAGTVQIKDNVMRSFGSPVVGPKLGSEIFFLADVDDLGLELWKTDGTTAGTKLVKDIKPGQFASSGIGPLTEAHGLLYFNADDGVHGKELWRTDGTPEGTVLVKDLHVGPGSSDPLALGVVNDRLYFRADDGRLGRELWAIDPAPYFAVEFFTDGSTVERTVGKEVAFGIRAADFDGDPLVLSASLDGLPVGSGGPGPVLSTPQGANPVTSMFSWTPTNLDAGLHELILEVTDGTSVTTYTLFIDVLGDSDGDGIPDRWETDGYTRDGMFVDLPNLLGIGQPNPADPNVPDIFVKVDYMKTFQYDHRPFNQAIQWVVQSFAARGINLHVIVGDAVPFSTSLGPDPVNYDWTEFEAIKSSYFPTAYEPVFRYCLFAHDLDGTSVSGISRNDPAAPGLGASDFIVSLGSWTNGIGDQSEQAGTFMHELGHALGLFHGGEDKDNNKPNYISVMNYSFQFGLIIDNLPPGEEYRRFDYSFAELPPLGETTFTEEAGLRTETAPGVFDPLPNLTGYGTRWYYFGNLRETPPGSDIMGPIDWNASGAIDPVFFQNLNNEGGFTTLDGHDDWANLTLTGGFVGGAGRPLPTVTPAQEIDLPTARVVFPAPPPNPSAPFAVAVVSSSTFTADSSGTATVLLDGTGSSDFDGDPITHWWTEDGTAIGNGALLSAEFAPGMHVVELVVEDQSRRSFPSTVTFEVLPPPVPTEENVDAKVSLSFGRAQFNRRTGEQSMTVTIMNISSDGILPPLKLAVTNISAAGVTVVNPDGQTAGGDPFLDLSGLLADGVFDPGETISTTLLFANPGRARFTFETDVYGICAPAPAAPAAAPAAASFAAPASAPTTTTATGPTVAGSTAGGTTPTVTGGGSGGTTVVGGTGTGSTASATPTPTPTTTTTTKTTTKTTTTTTTTTSSGAPTSGGTPSLSGGTTGEQPGVTEGGTKPAGNQKPAGPQGIATGELEPAK